MAWSISKRAMDNNPGVLGFAKLVVYDYIDAVVTTGTDVTIMDANDIIACWTGNPGVTVARVSKNQVNVLGAAGTEDGQLYVLYR